MASHRSVLLRASRTAISSAKIRQSSVGGARSVGVSNASGPASAATELSKLLGLDAAAFQMRSYSGSPVRLMAADREGKNENKGEGSEEQEEEEADKEKEALIARVSKLEEELKAAKARVAYTMAEMENVRAIARRDVDQARKFAVQGFAKALLDVADNLRRAISTVPDENRENEAVKSLLEGVEMTETQLQKVFAGQNLERFGNVGDAFDPNLHDALFEYDDPSQPPGSVGQVMKDGYKLQGRVIRAAHVGTTRKS